MDPATVTIWAVGLRALDRHDLVAVMRRTMLD
jgi:hypothetical protein